MANLDTRIRALEMATAPKLVNVLTYRPDGTTLPLEPGQQLATHYLLLPEVCATAEQWLERVRAEGMI
jgi:hypothetical protein